MSTTGLIRFDKVKMAATQVLVAFLGAFLIPVIMDIPVPIALKFIIGAVGALFFSAFSLVCSMYLFGSRVDGDKIENLFPALGHGSVNINSARLSKFPDIFFFRLVDEKSGSSVRVPRPFWSDDPDLVRKILEVVRRRQ